MSNGCEDCIAGCFALTCGVLFSACQEACNSYRPGGGGVCMCMRCCRSSFDRDSFDDHRSLDEAPVVNAQPAPAKDMGEAGPSINPPPQI